MANNLLRSSDVQDAYVSTLMADPVLVETFGADGWELEDNGGVKSSREFSLASTVIAAGSTRGNVASSPISGSTRFTPSNGTVIRAYQIGIVIYVSSKNRSAKAKRQLTDLTDTVVEVIESLKYVSDPNVSRNAWYVSELYQPICTRYRKFDNHLQSITIVNLYARRRVI